MGKSGPPPVGIRSKNGFHTLTCRLKKNGFWCLREDSGSKRALLLGPWSLKHLLSGPSQPKPADWCERTDPSTTSVLKIFCFHKKLEFTKCFFILFTKKIGPKMKITIFWKYTLKLRKVSWGVKKLETRTRGSSSVIEEVPLSTLR